MADRGPDTVNPAQSALAPPVCVARSEPGGRLHRHAGTARASPVKWAASLR